LRTKVTGRVRPGAGVSTVWQTPAYKALSPDGNPEFATVARVLKALGLRLSVAA
jgi:DNA-binding phage protein